MTSNTTEEASGSKPWGDEVHLAKLVESAQAGDINAFDEIVRLFQSPMFNLAYRMTGNREDAADLTQEIFVKLYRSIARFQGRSKFSTWLYALASNTCRSGLRKLKRVSGAEVVRLDDELSEETTQRRELPDTGDTPGRELERNEVIGAIEAIINELPEEYRMVLLLRDAQGLAYDEIAETLECSIGTVKSRLSRARTKAKDKLVREGLLCTVKK